MAQPIIINIGDKYGRLSILEDLGSKSNRRMVKCLCECGNEIITRLEAIRSGHTISCGCLKHDIMYAMKTTFKHGLRSHPLYDVWLNMKARCYKKTHKAYCYYGARGISVCEEWRNDFKCFYDWALLNGWAKGLEIDRRENDGNYEPSNGRFVTDAVNNENRRKNVIKPIYTIEDDYDGRMNNRNKINVGGIFGRYKILENAEYLMRGNRKYAFVKCLCECGTIKSVRYDFLKSGKTVSCGCYNRYVSSKEYKHLQTIK